MPRHQGRRGPRGEGAASHGVTTGWRWELSPAADKQLKHLSGEVQRRIIGHLDLLAAGSPTVDTRKRAGEEGYRLRVGNFRVVYDVDKTN